MGTPFCYKNVDQGFIYQLTLKEGVHPMKEKALVINHDVNTDILTVAIDMRPVRQIAQALGQYQGALLSVIPQILGAAQAFEAAVQGVAVGGIEVSESAKVLAFELTNPMQTASERFEAEMTAMFAAAKAEAEAAAKAEEKVAEEIDA